MPITYHFKPDARLVILAHIGLVPDDEFLSFYKSFYEDSRLDKSFNILIDLRRTESSARSPSAMQESVDFIRQQFVHTGARPKVAVVAPEDVSFGLARMCEVFSDAAPWEFEVFRSADDALIWLDAAKNLMDELDQFEKE
jgi:SpoIIAA-like